QLADGVGGEELAVGLRRREPPGGVLDAVLADVEAETARIVRPGAARTIEPAVLVVHHEERTNAFERLARSLEHSPDAARRTPAGGRMVLPVAGGGALRRRAAAN